MKFITYFGDYDNAVNNIDFFNMMKYAYGKKEYKKIMKQKWEHRHDEGMYGGDWAMKRFKNVSVGMFYNSNHFVSNNRAQSVFKFVKEEVYRKSISDFKL